MKTDTRKSGASGLRLASVPGTLQGRQQSHAECMLFCSVHTEATSALHVRLTHHPSRSLHGHRFLRLPSAEWASPASACQQQVAVAALQRAAGGEAQCRYCKLLPRSWVQSQGTPGLMSHTQQSHRAGGSATKYKLCIDNIMHSAAGVQANSARGAHCCSGRSCTRRCTRLSRSRRWRQTCHTVCLAAAGAPFGGRKTHNHFRRSRCCWFGRCHAHCRDLRSGWHQIRVMRETLR